jgi:hypothetical protein
MILTLKVEVVSGRMELIYLSCPLAKDIKNISLGNIRKAMTMICHTGTNLIKPSLKPTLKKALKTPIAATPAKINPVKETSSLPLTSDPTVPIPTIINSSSHNHPNPNATAVPKAEASKNQ